MAFNWSFYQETGNVGGLNTDTIYVDQINGVDGSLPAIDEGKFDKPVESIQRAIDIGGSFLHIVIASGSYQEGDFVGSKSQISWHPEGEVELDGTGFTSLNGTSIHNFNTDFYSVLYGGQKYNMRIKNYSTITSVVSSIGVHFKNISDCRLFQNNVFQDNIVDNCVLIEDSSWIKNQTIKRNSFINNTNFFLRALTGFNKFMSNYVDASSTLELKEQGAGTWDSIDFNHLQSGITFNGTPYVDSASFFAGEGANHGEHDIPSAQNPNFNFITPLDFTYQNGADGSFSDFEGKHIGAFREAKAVDGNSGFAGWVLGANLVLDGGTGDVSVSPSALETDPIADFQMTSIGFELFPENRIIERINLSDWEQSVGDGELIDTTLGADNIPQRWSLEIQYNTNGDVALGSATFNGTWLKMAWGGKPYVDRTTGSPNELGTDDNIGTGASADFDWNNAEELDCRHLMVRLTLRINEEEVLP